MALNAVTAAVLGVLVSLALTLAANTLFTQTSTKTLGTIPLPDISSLDLFSLALAVCAFIAIRIRKVPVIPVIVVAGIAGILRAII